MRQYNAKRQLWVKPLSSAIYSKQFDANPIINKVEATISSIKYNNKIFRKSQRPRKPNNTPSILIAIWYGNDNPSRGKLNNREIISAEIKAGKYNIA